MLTKNKSNLLGNAVIMNTVLFLIIGFSLVCAAGFDSGAFSKKYQDEKTSNMDTVAKGLKEAGVQDPCKQDKGDYYYYKKNKIKVLRNNCKIMAAYKEAGSRSSAAYKSDKAFRNAKCLPAQSNGVSFDIIDLSETIEDVARENKFTPMERESYGDKMARQIANDYSVKYVNPVYFNPQTGSSFSITDKVTVKPSRNQTIGALKSMAASYGLTFIKEMANGIGLFQVQNPVSQNGMDIANKISVIQGVEWAEPEFMTEFDRNSFPNDFFFNRQQHLENSGQNGGVSGADVRAGQAWDIMQGNSNVVIAIIDDGVQSNHPDLSVVSGGKNFCYDPPLSSADPVSADDNHGTSVAGIAAATGNNGIGVTGVNQLAKILPLKIFQGSSFAGSLAAANALYYATTMADVISCSWGGGSYSSLIADAIVYASTQGRNGKGCPVFFAAGNEGSVFKSYSFNLSGMGMSNGSYILAFAYKKDVSYYAGEDLVAIDNFSVTAEDGYTILTKEDFSAGIPSGWVGMNGKGWTVTNSMSYPGMGDNTSLRSGVIGNNDVSEIRLPVMYLTVNQKISFQVKLSTEIYFDKLWVRLYDANGNYINGWFGFSGITTSTAGVSFPAYSDSAIAVGASTDHDYRSGYSQFSESGKTVDFVCPSNGGWNNITTTDRTGVDGYNNSGDYTFDFGGTSAATPLASGVASLILSKSPWSTRNQVLGTMQSNCDKIGNVTYSNGKNAEYGFGRLNAARCLQSLLAVPVLVSPANNAKNVDLNPALSWNMVNGAQTYRIQVSEQADFSSLIVNDSGYNSLSKAIGPLTNSKTYYWRVKGESTNSISDWSPVWNFEVIMAPPSAPVLSLPDDNVVDQPVSLSLAWSLVSTATAYHVQVSTVSDFSTIYMQDSLLTTGSTTFSGLSNSTKYYWRVRAKNIGGASAWTIARSFTTIIAQPGMPALTLPSDNAIDQPTSLPLSWTTVSTATAYHVQVSTVSDFSTIYMQDSLLTTGSTTVSGLSNSTKYSWRVRAKNIGGASAWTIARSFTTIIAQPGMPALTLPADNAIDQPTSLPLSWTTVSTATAYHVQVSTVNDFSTIYMQDSLLTTGSTTVSGLSNSTKYYWRVRAKNIGGASAWTIARSFTTIIAQPGMPALTLPADNAIDQPTSLPLSWTTVSTATAYHVQVSTVSDFSTIYMQDSLLTTGSTTVSGLSNSTKYSWRVRAKNIGGASAWTIARSFTTIIAQPGMPALTLPADNAIDQPTSLPLSWTTVSTATAYHVQVSTVNDFSTIYMQDSLLTTGSTTVSGLSNSTKYYWRVRAKNIGGASAWTIARSFTTIIAQPGMPVLTLPADNAIDQPVSLPLSWTTVSTATAYHVQVSTVSDFSTINMQDSLLTTGSTTVSGLSNSTKYYWRVRAKNIGGASAWTSARSFTTIIAQPGMPVLALPADNTIDQPVSLALAWSTVSTATAYHVQVSTASDFSTIYMQDSLLTTGSTTVRCLSNSTKYYWRVRAKNIGGASTWTSASSFTTIIAQPGVPVLTLPNDNAIDQPVSLSLAWSLVSTATVYHVQVSTVSDFSTIYMEDSLLTAGSTTVSGLSNSTKYYWRVRAKNIGGASAWTIARSFTTIIAQPGMPALTLPSDNAIDQPVSLPLSWTTVSTATAYHVQVSMVSDFSTIYMQDSLLTTGSTTVSGLTNSTKYYWRVRAKNVGGASAWTSARSFTTIIAHPGMPLLSLPNDNAIDQPVSLSLSWNTVASATAYHVQVSTVNDFSTIYMQDSLLTAGSTTVSGLSNSTKYYWRVRAKNIGGASAWTSARSFTTIIAQPSMPVLTLHADNAIDQPVSLPLSWTTVSTATVYHVQVSTVSDFSTIYMQDSLLTTGSTTVSDLSNSTKYYWRVRAKNIGGASAWTNARSFTTIIAQPGMPVLSLPNDNAIDQPVSLSLSWNTVASATAYHVQVSTVNDFSTIYMQDSLLTAGSTIVSGLSNSTTYYWRVRAKNIGGASAWIIARNFTTIIAQPGMPVLSLPNDNAIDQPVSLSLAWSLVSTAQPIMSKYLLPATSQPSTCRILC